MSYNVKDMQQFAFQVMCQAGLSEEESAVFSDSLVKADMRGISSHGMTRLATYAKRVEDGLVAGHVTPEIIKDGLGVIAVDGKNGMGAYVGAWTMERCMERAEKYGNCFAAVRGGNHFGYAAYFTELAARGGMLGLAIANGFSALAGGVLAQKQAFFDISIGTGTMVFGLASVILGTQLFHRFRKLKATTAVIAGAILYKACVAFVISMRIVKATDLKLITAAILLLILIVSDSMKRKGAHHA